MDYEDSGSPYVSTEYTDVPGWPKVIGIISIVLASLGLVCGGLGAIAVPFQSAMIEPMLDGDPMPDALKVNPIQVAVLLFGLGFAVLLMLSGIWLIRRRPAARVMHLVWALCSAVNAIVSLVLQFQAQESLKAWAQDYPNNTYAQQVNSSGQAVGQLVGLALGLVLGLGIPIFYLIWFGVIKTKPEQITGTPVEVD